MNWLRNNFYIFLPSTKGKRQKNNLSFADRDQLELKRHETVFQLNGTKKQAGLAILIFENIDFKLKLVKRDKEWYHLLTKHHCKQFNFKNVLLKEKTQINYKPIIVDDFKTYFLQYTGTLDKEQRNQD